MRLRTEAERIQNMASHLEARPPILLSTIPVEGVEREKTIALCKELLGPGKFSLGVLPGIVGSIIDLTGGERIEECFVDEEGNVKRSILTRRSPDMENSGWGNFYWQVRTNPGNTGIYYHTQLGLFREGIKETFLCGLFTDKTNLTDKTKLTILSVAPPPEVYISPEPGIDLKRGIYPMYPSILLVKYLPIPEHAKELIHQPGIEEIRWMLVRQYNHTFPDSQPIYLRTPVPK